MKTRKTLFLCFLLIAPLLLISCQVMVPSDDEESSSTTTESGTVLTVGTAVSGSLTSGGETTYRFTASSTGDYTIYVFNKSISDADVDFSYTKNDTLDYCFSYDNCVIYGVTQDETIIVTLSERSNVDWTFSIIVVSGNGGEGTDTNPIALTLGTVHPAAIGWDDNYYKFTTGANPGTFEITTVSNPQDLTWNLTNASGGFVDAFVNSNNEIGTVAITTTNLDSAETYYLNVNNSSHIYGNISIKVEYDGTSLGSVNDPVALTVGATYSEGSVAGGGYSYYRFDSTNSTHTITVTTSAYEELWSSLFDNTNFLLENGLKACSYYVGGITGSFSCSISDLNIGSTYYLRINNVCRGCDTTDVTFGIDIQ